MAQHDYTIANQTFPNTRTDINNALSAIVSQNSGASAPSTTYAYQLWYDTTNNKLKQRNADDDAWIDLFDVDQVADTATPSTGGAGGGGLLKTAISRIDTVQSVASTTQAELADFGSFTPSLTTSTIYITGNALIGGPVTQYFGYKWVVDGVDYLNGTLSSNATAGYYITNGYQMRVAPLTTSISNTDGSAITVSLHARSNSGTVYLNRSTNQTNADNASQGISEIMFLEVSV